MKDERGACPLEEDRELARRLCEGDGEAQAFLEQSLERRTAGQVRRWIRNAGVRGRCDALDLLHEFMVRKVLDPEAAQRVFGPVAEGERSFWPRVLCCLRNFVIDFLRRPEPPSEPLPFDLSVAGHIGGDPSFVRALGERRAYLLEDCARLFASRRAPYYPALLLSERVLMADRITAECRAGGLGDASTLWFKPTETSEAWVPWPSGLEGEPFMPGGPTLKWAWEALRRRIDRQEPVRIKDVAEILGVSRDRWDQWLSRARRRVIDDLGEETARELFVYWPWRPGEDG